MPSPDDTSDGSPPRRLTPLWRNVSFTLMWTSTAASGFGDRMIMLAALVLLGGFVEGADRVSVNAAINFWFFLPYVLLSVVGGWLADRLPRKWLLLACDEARAGLLLLAFVMVGGFSGAVVPADYQWRVMAILFGVGCFAAIFSPTRNAIIPQIIPLRQLQPGNAVLISIATIASMIGMLVGGILIDENDGGSVRTGLMLALLFYAVSGTFFAFLRIGDPHPGVQGQPRRRFGSATRYVLQHRRILLLIGMNVLVWGAAMVVFQAVLSLSRLAYALPPDQQLQRYTQLATMLGVGMIAGAGVVTAIRTRRESDLVMMTGVMGAGLCTLLLAITPVFALGMIFAFGVGLFGNVTIITITSLLQSIAPNYIRGRIMGVSGMLNTVSNVTINFIIWQMPNADRGIIVTCALMGPALMAIGAWGLVRGLTRGPQHCRAANVFWRLARFYTLVWHRVEWRGRHHIPRTGGLIIASNHTTGLDPFLIQSGCPRLIRWLMLTSYRFRLLEPLWRTILPITLDKDESDRNKIRQLVVALEEGDLVGLFPEGGLQREHRELGEFQPGIAMIARRSGAAILPTFIEGTPRTRNMLWHFLRPSRSRVTFGKPYQPDPKQRPEQILQELRERMQALDDTRQSRGAS